MRAPSSTGSPADARADRAPRGTIGYGKSGAWALMVAGIFPGEIAAAASVLGFGFVTDGPDSPHLRLDAVRGEIYCAFAELDEIIPRAVADDLAPQLSVLPIPTQFIMHAGARHPYAFPDRAVYDRQATESDWQHIFAMFARRLVSQQ